MSRLVDTFCDMVRISSESGQEAQFIAYLKDLFSGRFGATCTTDGYGNLVAKIPAKGSTVKEPVLFGVHADTVKPGQDIEPVIENGIIRSKGETILGADDKAGIVEIFEAVRTAESRPPVEIVITREEETGLLGAKNLDRAKVRADMGFILDGDDLDTAVIGGPTYIALDVEITGRAAHAGMEPEKGISAIRVAAKAIAAMPEGRIDEETTANVGTIEGGLIRNGVPGKVTLRAECRSLNHDKCVRQAAVMQQAFEKAAAEMGAKADVKLTTEFRASQIPEDSPAVQAAKAAITAVGLDPKAQVITGGTDALVLNEKGIAAVVLGYGGQEAHATQEHIAITDMEKAVSLLRHLLAALA